MATASFPGVLVAKSVTTLAINISEQPKGEGKGFLHKLVKFLKHKTPGTVTHSRWAWHNRHKTTKTYTTDIEKMKDRQFAGLGPLESAIMARKLETK